MSWFLCAIVALFCWSGSDFFSKIGCRDSKDKYSQFKMVMAVGLVMGAHAVYEILLGGVHITWDLILMYLPVSLLYIGSMTLGYVGLRYIELSISSPICNASGALVAILAVITGTSDPMDWPQYLAIVLACAGVIGLGFVEASEDDQLRTARQEASNYKYAKSWMALALPLAYCLLDAAGTFADDIVLGKYTMECVQANASPEFAHLFLEEIPESFEGLVSADALASVESFVKLQTERAADTMNVAYELTFLAAGLVCFVYTCIIKKQRLLAKLEAPKYIGATFETIGQVAYVYALNNGNVALAAPVISSYCLLSVVWSRIFLKEKLSFKHYVCIGVTFAGILIMGIYDM